MLFRSIFTLTKCHEEFSMIYQGVAVSRCKWYECTKLGVSIILITTPGTNTEGYPGRYLEGFIYYSSVI